MAARTPTLTQINQSDLFPKTFVYQENILKGLNLTLHSRGLIVTQPRVDVSEFNSHQNFLA